MPVYFEKLPDQPIMIATIEGFASVDEIRSTFEHSATHIADCDELVYYLTDTSQMTMSYTDLILAIQAANGFDARSSLGERIVPVVVGPGELAMLAADALSNEMSTGVHMPAFPSVGDALNFLQEYLDPDSLYADLLD